MTERQRIASGSPFESTIGFSRAMRVGDVGDRVLVSGTGPVAADGRCPDDAGAQARRCFEIIAAALDEAGASLDDVVRTRMYLTSADDADAVGTVHGELLGYVRPAATMVVVAGLLDPAWKVEIEAEAVVPDRARATATARGQGPLH
jgi:enamine deaminase RidA (YjgF/YER057c/UK114 family)